MPDKAAALRSAILAELALIPDDAPIAPLLERVRLIRDRRPRPRTGQLPALPKTGPLATAASSGD